MRNVIAIAHKELRSYFSSPMAYIIIGFFALPFGVFFYLYLDAFVPENGKCVLDYVVPERAARMREEGERTGSVTPPPLSLWGITKQEHIDFIQPREVRHPYGCFSQKIRLMNAPIVARTFVYCSAPATGSFDQFAARYRNDPQWRYHQLETGHDAMILMPERVAELLQK